MVVGVDENSFHIHQASIKHTKSLRTDTSWLLLRILRMKGIKDDDDNDDDGLKLES